MQETMHSITGKCMCSPTKCLHLFMSQTKRTRWTEKMSVYAHFLRGGSKYNADIVKDVNQILLVYYLV